MQISSKSIDRKRIFGLAVRLCFFAVFVVNVQCALSFVIQPGAFVGGFELSGPEGEAAVRGLGVAFLMWNCTYPLFILRPRSHMSLGAIIIMQQVIGLVGETWILAGLESGHGALFASILRFVIFDGVGLALMAVSWCALLIALRAKDRTVGKDGR